MVGRSALVAASDLDAVLIGPWVWPPWLVRVRLPLFLLLVLDAALLPLTFSGLPWIFAAVVVAVVVAGLVLIFVLVMEAKSGTRLVGYSARGVFVPDLVPWGRVTGVAVGKTETAGRAVTIERADGDPLEVAVPKTVTEPEYRAFAAALRAEAEGRGIRLR
jgi:phosphoglycerol transferase MdoB-like AlkP superfamily enzyme